MEDWWDHEHEVGNRPWSVTTNPNIQQLCCYWDDFDGVQNDECPPNRATLECAKRNLETFTVVGIQDEYGMFLQLLQVRLGITLVEHMNKDYSVNVRKPAAEETTNGNGNGNKNGKRKRKRRNLNSYDAAAAGHNTTNGAGGQVKIGGGMPAVPEAMLRKFEESSKLDKELYEYASTLFWKQAKESLGVAR